MLLPLLLKSQNMQYMVMCRVSLKATRHCKYNIICQFINIVSAFKDVSYSTKDLITAFSSPCTAIVHAKERADVAQTILLLSYHQAEADI